MRRNPWRRRARTFELDIDLLAPNDYQPRTHVDDERLQELARSIKSNGVIQPIVVRRLDAGGDRETTVRYQIIAGERRWRAAQLAGLLRVPVVVKELAGDEKKQRLEMALIENVQRENLNPIEEAHAYQRLADEFDLKQDDIALAGRQGSLVGRQHAATVAASRGGAGRGRSRPSLDGTRASDRLALERRGSAAHRARRAHQKSLGARDGSDRQEEPATPSLTRNRRRSQDAPTTCTRARRKSSCACRSARRSNIKRRGKGGRVEIAFTSEDELQRIYEYLTNEGRRTKN